MNPGMPVFNNRIEPDSRTDPLSDLLDGVIGKSRDIKIFLDVADAGSRGERSRAALHRPRQQDLSGGFVDALRNAGDHRIVGQPGFNTMTQSSEGLHHDAIPLAIVEQIPFREIWMGFDLNHSWLYACDSNTSFSCPRLTFDRPIALHRPSSTRLSKAFQVSVRVVASS